MGLFSRVIQSDVLSPGGAAGLFLWERRPRRDWALESTSIRREGTAPTNHIPLQ